MFHLFMFRSHAVDRLIIRSCFSGIEVPTRDDSLPKKKPVYGDKRKKKEKEKPVLQTPEGITILLLFTFTSRLVPT